MEILEIQATLLLVDHYKPPEPTAEQASPQASPNCDDHVIAGQRADASSPGMSVNRCNTSRAKPNTPNTEYSSVETAD